MPEPGRTEQAPIAPDISPYLLLIEQPSDRQKEILAKLPSIADLVQRLHGHILSQYQEGHLVPGRDDEAREAAYVAGELAEILTQAEYDTYPLVLDGRELVRSANPTDREVMEKLLGLFHNPDVLLSRAKIGRNPDLAWLDVDQRVIRVIGEVKLAASLDDRCFRQLRSDGFIANIKATLKYLNDHPRFGKKIFGEDVAGRPQKGHLATDVIEVVFLPQDTDLTPDNREKLIRTKEKDPDHGLNQANAVEFLDLMKSGQVKLVHFSFSRQEVRALTKEMMKRIKERYPPKASPASEATGSSGQSVP